MFVYVAPLAAKSRAQFTTYSITSHEFSTPTHGSLYLYTTGRISWVAGGVSIPVSRQQAASILADAHTHPSMTVTRNDG